MAWDFLGEHVTFGVDSATPGLEAFSAVLVSGSAAPAMKLAAAKAIAALAEAAPSTPRVAPSVTAAVCNSQSGRPVPRGAGVFGLWRDGGFAAGALLSGFLADLYGIPAAVAAVAALTAASGLVVALRMRPKDHLPGAASPGTADSCS